MDLIKQIANGLLAEAYTVSHEKSTKGEDGYPLHHYVVNYQHPDSKEIKQVGTYVYDHGTGDLKGTLHGKPADLHASLGLGKSAKNNYQHKIAKDIYDHYKTNLHESVLTELSKKTLSSYIKKATDDVSYNSFAAGEHFANNVKDGKFVGSREDGKEQLGHDKKAMKRQKGVNKAADKLAEEEVSEGSSPTTIHDNYEAWEKHAKQMGAEISHDAEDADRTQSFAKIKTKKKPVVGGYNHGKNIGTIYGPKPVKESLLSELSQNTLKSYVSKASQDLKSKEAELDRTPITQDASDLVKKMGDRNVKIADAKKKLPRGNPHAVVAEDASMAADEDEESMVGADDEDMNGGSDEDIVEATLTELSKKTLGSYIEKAVDDVDEKAYDAGTQEFDGTATGKYVPKLEKSIDKRKDGVKKAIKKLTKEGKESEHGANLELAKTKDNNKSDQNDYHSYNEKKESKKAKKPVKEDVQLNEERAVFTGQFIASLRDNPLVDKIVNAHYLSDGSTALVRLKDGNAYEIEVRPATLAKNHQKFTKPKQYKARKEPERAKARTAWGWDKVLGDGAATEEE